MNSVSDICAVFVNTLVDGRELNSPGRAASPWFSEGRLRYNSVHAWWGLDVLFCNVLKGDSPRGQGERGLNQRKREKGEEKSRAKGEEMKVRKEVRRGRK